MRLLENLTGDAFEKVESVDLNSLYQPDGVNCFKKIVWRKYEPMERCRDGRVMIKFFDTFDRKHDEEIMDYNTRFDKQLEQAEKVA